MSDLIVFLKKTVRGEWFTEQLKGMHCSKLGMWKGYHLWIKGARKGYLFHQKWYTELKGRSLPYEILLSNPHPPPRESILSK